jgi:hypothetical protein
VEKKIMANARLYALNRKATFETTDGKTKKYISNLKGQAKVIFDDLKNNPAPRLAKEVLKSCEGKFETTQDPFRVVLYYILVFKSRGFISVFDPDVENESENAFAGVIPADEN